MIYKITAGGCLHYDLNTFKVNWYLQETLQVLLMKVVCKKYKVDYKTTASSNPNDLEN